MADKYFKLISDNLAQGIILAILFFIALVFYRYLIPEIVIGYLDKGIYPKNKKSINRHYFIHFLVGIISTTIVFFFLLVPYEALSREGTVLPFKYLIAFFFISIVSYMNTIIIESKKTLNDKIE